MCEEGHRHRQGGAHTVASSPRAHPRTCSYTSIRIRIHVYMKICSVDWRGVVVHTGWMAGVVKEGPYRLLCRREVACLHGVAICTFVHERWGECGRVRVMLLMVVPVPVTLVSSPQGWARRTLSHTAEQCVVPCCCRLVPSCVDGCILAGQRVCCVCVCVCVCLSPQ